MEQNLATNLSPTTYMSCIKNHMMEEIDRNTRLQFKLVAEFFNALVHSRVVGLMAGLKCSAG